MNQQTEPRPRCAEACTCGTSHQSHRPANDRAASCGCAGGCACGSDCRCGR